MYVSNLVSSDITYKYCLKTEKCEELWLNVKLDSKSYFVISTLYRHPRSNAFVFCEKLNATLSNLNKTTKKFLILGDLNLNTTGCNQHPHAKGYLNILSSNAAFPLITKPTRITSTSPTLLDHIITNITQNTLLPGILRSDLSDHFPTFCFILLDSKPFKITLNKKFDPCTNSNLKIMFKTLPWSWISFFPIYPRFRQLILMLYLKNFTISLKQ